MPFEKIAFSSFAWFSPHEAAELDHAAPYVEPIPSPPHIKINFQPPSSPSSFRLEDLDFFYPSDELAGLAFTFGTQQELSALGDATACSSILSDLNATTDEQQLSSSLLTQPSEPSEPSEHQDCLSLMSTGPPLFVAPQTEFSSSRSPSFPEIVSPVSTMQRTYKESKKRQITRLSCASFKPRNRQREKKFRCDCGKSYQDKPSLTRHQRVCKGEQARFACSECCQTFAQKASLNRHLKEQHQGHGRQGQN